MQITRIDKDGLRRLLALTEKKEQILESLREIEEQIQETAANLGVQFVDSTSLPVPTASANSPRSRSQSKTPKTAGRPSRRPHSEGRSGALKDRIVSLLATAGPQGMRVKDVAKALDVKVANISVWFSTTGKKFTTKLAPGVFALNSELSQTKSQTPETSKPTTTTAQPQTQPQIPETIPSTESATPPPEQSLTDPPAATEQQLILTEQIPSNFNA